MLTPRDPAALQGGDYDLIVVGGGVYGIMVALEAARRGLRPLLIERDDFGAATSHNSLRIVHGGLRFLQSLDLPRFRESVTERRWFLRHFPDLVRPLPCLMPLYGEGVRRPAVLRAVLALNDALSARRNAGVMVEQRLPRGRVLGVAETREMLPGIDPRDLEGAALWHDAAIPDAPRLLIEALRWACAHGARALNYVEARAPIVAHGRIAGLRAVDTLKGAECAFRAPLAINATGPWTPAFAGRCGARGDGLFEASLAWNVVLDRTPPSACALAVRPRRPGARTYFLVPWKGAILAGTGHAPWAAGTARPEVPPDLLRAFIADLDEALPALALNDTAVARVFSGLLPARRPGTAELALRPVIHDHGARGGPAGLYSVSGVKLTSARYLADKVLTRAVPDARPVPYARFTRPPAVDAEPDYGFAWMPDPQDRAWLKPLRRAVAEDAVQHLDDLLLRRSSLGDNPRRAMALADQAAGLFDWDRARVVREVAALADALGTGAAKSDAVRQESRVPC